MKFVHNLKGNRWLIVAPSRLARPHDNLPSPPRSTDVSCPFEPENDALNKELFRIGDPWKVRVIENKYPLTQYHEVVIHGPEHDKDIDELPLEHVQLILQAYRQRYNFNKRFGNVLIFNNHDIHAGASISHSHSQIVVVPPDVTLENILRESINNVVFESKSFLVYCPDYSEWPYELWIAPKENVFSTFGAITDEEIVDLAPVLQKVLRSILKKFTGPDIPYNFYIYHGENWYLRIIPRFIHRAGFELGTGISVNIVDPKMAAEEYKSLLSNS